MKAWIWYRALAVILAIFTLGHTIGTIHPITTSPAEAAVIAVMHGYRVPVMGFHRTYWEFYRGFSISITLLLATLVVIAWQLATLSRRNPRETLPLGMTVLLACVGQAIVSVMYFFTAPIVMSLAAVVCAGMGVALVARDASGVSDPH